MKTMDCAAVGVAILSVVCGLVLFNLEEQPHSLEDLVLELFVLKSRVQFGMEDGKCASRGTDAYTVSCRHRAFEEMFTTFEIANLNILRESGLQAYIDSTQTNLRKMEDKTKKSALKRYPKVDLFDTKLAGLAVSVALPPSLQRDWTGGPSSKVAVFLHAGGYAFGWSEWASEFRARLAHDLDIPVVSLNYTLSWQESPSVQAGDPPTFLRESLLLLEWLRDQQRVPWSNIVVIGDSAGGGLAVSLMNYLQRTVGESVGLCVGISPWTETCEFRENESFFLNRHTDPMIETEETIMTGLINFVARDPDCWSELTKPKQEMLAKCQKMIADGCANEYWNPRRLADFSGVRTKFLLQAALGELLKDDAALMHEKLVNSGVRSDLVLSPTNLHVLPTMFPSLEDGEKVLTQIIDWIRLNWDV